MAIDGRINEYYFPLNFIEYMQKEQLKWSSLRGGDNLIPNSEWLFWSQEDHEIEPALSHDNCADSIPNVCAIPKFRDDIRLALQKMMILCGSTLTRCSLVQFWAATKTLEGRTFLTTQSQPFALGQTDYAFDRQRLCEYRMKMCKEYKFFNADAESGEEQLGLLGRVFLHKFPESSPDVDYYTTKEYPQRDLALLCNIIGCWAMPVFEHSSQTCVGVLEIVSLHNISTNWRNESVLSYMSDSFQEFGLQCFGGYKICEMQCRKKKRKKGLTTAFEELYRVLRSVCKIHELPLAMTWVPCCACNGFMQGPFCSEDGFSTGIKFCQTNLVFTPLTNFLKIGKYHHLRKGLVARRALSSLNMLYCSDITQLSVDDYHLVPYARLCKFSSWFTICLQSVYTGNDIYVLEFFLSARSKDDENILTKLGFILGTMEENFETFRLASGKELGELMPCEFIHFQNDQKIHSKQLIQATRNFSSSSSDPSSVQSSPSVANTRPGFQDANMVTFQAKYHSNSGPSFEQSSASVANTRPGFQDANMVTIEAKYHLNSDPSSEQSSASVANTRPRFQDANMVTIKAKYASIERMLKLSLPCRLVELQQEVAKRMMLGVGTYDVVYKDEEDGGDEIVLIACDEDLQTYVVASISPGNPSPVVLLLPKEPTTNLNPTN